MKKLPNVEAMLERQVKSWEIRRRLAKQGGEASIEAMAHVPEGPWITVSSPAGSGGLELAHALGRALDWQVFDREILRAISENTKTHETVLARFDQKTMGTINEYVARLINPDLPGSVAFHREVVRMIWGLAQQGNAIILGRGANWLLDPRFGLRIRAVAPIEARAERIAARDGIDLGAAREKALARDVEQADFIRQAYDQEIGDPLGYDLILNLGHLDEATAVQLALLSLRQRLGGS